MQLIKLYQNTFKKNPCRLSFKQVNITIITIISFASTFKTASCFLVIMRF